MSRDEVLNRIDQLDVLYNKLDVLDQELKQGKLKEIDFLIQEQDIKKQIDKLFEV
jgi:hypothetical protein